MMFTRFVLSIPAGNRNNSTDTFNEEKLMKAEANTPQTVVVVCAVTRGNSQAEPLMT